MSSGVSVGAENVGGTSTSEGGVTLLQNDIHHVEDGVYLTGSTTF